MEAAVIARIWAATARRDRVDAYVAYLREKTLPQLTAIHGHRGAYVLTHRANEIVDITVVTLWDSLDAIRRFSPGRDPEVAVVPRDAQDLLNSWDLRAVHWDVAHQTMRLP
jgi:heme-degrading monooxygenase HmoA